MPASNGGAEAFPAVILVSIAGAGPSLKSELTSGVVVMSESRSRNPQVFCVFH